MLEGNSMKHVKRTLVDFHEHIVEEVVNESVNIIKLHKPNTNIHSVTFINTQGILAVTGDFGNWVFCREFHPSADGYVSDHYWCEKANINSSQKPYVFSESVTDSMIINTLRELRLEDDSMTEEEEYYLEQCLLESSNSEWEYVAYAYKEKPYNWDAEDVPFGQEVDRGLQVIFDAFEELCKRIKESNLS
jgi:hypothetical protein